MSPLRIFPAAVADTPRMKPNSVSLMSATSSLKRLLNFVLAMALTGYVQLAVVSY